MFLGFFCFYLSIAITFLALDFYIEHACALGKGKVFPYSLPSVGPGADPGVQAVSPQVT